MARSEASRIREQARKKVYSYKRFCSQYGVPFDRAHLQKWLEVQIMYAMSAPLALMVLSAPPTKEMLNRVKQFFNPESKRKWAKMARAAIHRMDTLGVLSRVAA